MKPAASLPVKGVWTKRWIDYVLNDGSYVLPRRGLWLRFVRRATESHRSESSGAAALDGWQITRAGGVRLVALWLWHLTTAWIRWIVMAEVPTRVIAPSVDRTKAPQA
jgi:hypothetical protein